MTSESPPPTSETFEARQARLEANYRADPMITISRSCLVDMLERAYLQYEKCWAHDDKVNAIYWDGVLRALHRVLDMEITHG
ncbi:MAG: hypothetical protein CMO47_00405 [Verrucomicrobiales bacterium]|nr:hypothetical protein [Verrucomicrobiales bacterium]